MRTSIILCCLFFALKANARYYGNADFISRCYFSEDGQMALVSELGFIRIGQEILPVFGWYKTGKNTTDAHIALSDDSVYFYRDSVLPPIVDSVFSSQTFMSRYHFTRLGTDITDHVTFEIRRVFLEKQNTIKLQRLDEITAWKFKAADTRFFNYFIRFKYDGRAFFKDTLPHVYAGKKLLSEGLKETMKKNVYDPNSGWLRGTEGYGTRVYFDKEYSCFFIRAKYDVSNPVVVTCVSFVNETGRQEQSNTLYHLPELIELRVLGKF